MDTADLTNLSLPIAIISLVISALTFWQNSEPQQQKRRQNEAFRLLAAQSALGWEQWQLAMQETSGRHDPFLLESIRLTAGRLEDAIDQAVAVGLFGEFIGDSTSSLTMHAAFIGSLHEVSHAPDYDSLRDRLSKQHYMFGLVRLLKRCQENRIALFTPSLRKKYQLLFERFGNEPWNYLSSVAKN